MFLTLPDFSFVEDGSQHFDLLLSLLLGLVVLLDEDSNVGLCPG